MVDLDVILVNYRNPSDTRACLESIGQAADDKVRIILVDNGSADGSAGILSEYLSASGLRGLVIENPENRGFAGGCNTGIERALRDGTPYILLLNNDTLVPGNFFAELRRAIADHPGALLSGRITDERTGAPSFSVGRVSPLSLVVRHIVDPRGGDYLPMDFVSGGLMLIPAPVVARIGSLREDFFMYCEDQEFCMRARDAGVPIVFASRVGVRHKVGSTSDSTGLPKVYYVFRNQTRITLERGSRIHILFYLLFLLTQIPALARRPRIIGQFLSGIRDGWAGRLGRRNPRLWRGTEHP